MALTTQNKIDTGRVCAVLAANALENGTRNGGVLDTRLPTLLNITTTVLEDLYEIDPTNVDVEPIGNYLISICRNYARAQYILGLGGGGTIPSITPGSSAEPLIFVVDASTSPIIDGQSSLSITDFIGFNLSFSRGGIVQSTVTSESSYYTWDKTTGLFTCSPAAITSELFILMPV